MHSVQPMSGADVRASFAPSPLMVPGTDETPDTAAPDSAAPSSQPPSTGQGIAGSYGEYGAQQRGMRRTPPSHARACVT